MTRTAPDVAPTANSGGSTAPTETPKPSGCFSSRMEDRTAGQRRTTADLGLSDAVAEHPFRTATGSERPTVAPNGAPTPPRSAPLDAALALTHTPRPTRTEPQLNHIPDELKARPQWVVWKWQLRKNKWTKPPYNPYTRKPAKVNDPTTWATYIDAVYECVNHGWDGIGYVFTANDPYTGIDLDDCIDQSGTVAPWAAQIVAAFNTYSEISPSECGVKMIARGSMPEAGKKHGLTEMYRSGHYFTFTGNRLPDTPAEIRPAQPAIDRLYHTIRSRNADEGTQEGGSTSSRAVERPQAGGWAAQHSAAEWEQARRAALHVVTVELHGDPTALPGGIGPNTQTGLVLRGEYARFHERWPFVGVLRGDDTPDEHMIRAVAAAGFKGRGYSFPRYAALMDYYFGAYCRAKWHNERDGGRAAWREELARLWAKAPAPAYIKGDSALAPQQTRQKAKKAAPAPRGRPWLDHAQQQRAAIHAAIEATPADEDGRRHIDTQALALTIGTSRRMAQLYIKGMERDGEIKSERIPGTRQRYAILVEHRRTTAECPGSPPAVVENSAKLNQHDQSTAEGAMERITTPQIVEAAPVCVGIEETHRNADLSSCVSSGSAIGFASSSAEPPAPARPPTLTALVRDALEAYPGVRMTVKRIRAYVEQNAHGRQWSDAALQRTIEAERQRRQRLRYDSIRQEQRAAVIALADDELLKAIRARRTTLTRNRGKRREWYYELRLEVAEKERERRGLKMPDPKPGRRSLAPRRSPRSQTPAPAVAPLQLDMLADDAPPGALQGASGQERVSVGASELARPQPPASEAQAVAQPSGGQPDEDPIARATRLMREKSLRAGWSPVLVGAA